MEDISVDQTAPEPSTATNSPAASGKHSAASQPQEIEFDLGDQKVRASELTADTLKQWRDAHRNQGKWQAEYTQRDQALAKERTELAKYRQLIDRINGDSEITKYIAGRLTAQTNTLPPEVRRELEEMRTFKEAQEQKDLFARFKAETPAFDDAKFLAFAHGIDTADTSAVMTLIRDAFLYRTVSAEDVKAAAVEEYRKLESDKAKAGLMPASNAGSGQLETKRVTARNGRVSLDSIVDAVLETTNS